MNQQIKGLHSQHKNKIITLNDCTTRNPELLRRQLFPHSFRSVISVRSYTEC